MIYCDYIAHLISTYIKPHDTQGLLSDVSRPRIDLDPEGALSSTDKTIVVEDFKGQKYRITVEEIRESETIGELFPGTWEALKSLTIRGE